MDKRTLIFILAAIAVILSIPLIAMQFTDNVNWSFFDFVSMAVLLFVTGIACLIVLKRVSHSKYRIAMIMVILVAVFLIWVELGVGILGTPFAGS